MSGNTINTTEVHGKLLSRHTFLRVLDAALAEQHIRFARQAALNWLAIYPGDLRVSYQLAQAFVAEDKSSRAIPVLEKVLLLDPEFVEAYRLLVKILERSDPKKAEEIYASLYALGSRVPEKLELPEWSKKVRAARTALQEKRFQEAESISYEALGQKPDSILASLTHLEVTRLNQDTLTVMKFAELYHTRWSDTLLFSLLLAEMQMEVGEEASAVNLLHLCVAGDAAGQVPARWWGQQHPYLPLWPESLEIDLDMAIPAGVAVRMGWNMLPAPLEPLAEEAHPGADTLPDAVIEEPVRSPVEDTKPTKRIRPTSEVAREAEAEFERLARRLKKPSIAKADGRFPVYVILSTQTGLTSQYGIQSFQVIDRELAALSQAVSARSGWNAMVYYPDNRDSMTKLGMKPIATSDPWKIKLSLADLDAVLASKGERIGAVIIIGGPEVVPFHRLPNPTEDVDDEVLSDNPYATLDHNYFVPEWPVGRLPGETGKDAGLLLAQIRRAEAYHRGEAKASGKKSLLDQAERSLRRWLEQLGSRNVPSSFGYTAAVWQKASRAVYTPIGDVKAMMTCPPAAFVKAEAAKQLSAPYGYFNLHGMEDGPEWYGQREANDPVPGPDFPVALKPESISKNGRTPEVVFTEACYGGHILYKSEKDSIALRFLSVGVRTMVGSTCTSYGSVNTPLMGADLLASLFWKAYRDGYPAGEALLQAKLGLTREMTRRQGCLDGEDQKTLIQFVLYGDPLMTTAQCNTQPKNIVRQRGHLAVKTVCDQPDQEDGAELVTREALKQVKSALEGYLPGVDRAEMTIISQCTPLAEPGSKNTIPGDGKRVVITFRKQVQLPRGVAYQYARVTLNKEGKMVKMALSR